MQVRIGSTAATSLRRLFTKIADSRLPEPIRRDAASLAPVMARRMDARTVELAAVLLWNVAQHRGWGNVRYWATFLEGRR
jgi:hypothetical protein